MAAARARRAGRNFTNATHMAATGPKSGPITMAPTISTGLSTTMPQAAIIDARAMNTKNDGVGVASSRAWASTCSHTVALAREARRRRLGATSRGVGRSR